MPSETTTAHPPRYRQLKRLSILTIALLLLLAAYRLWWGRQADKLLNADISRLQSQHEPILPEDFDSPPMPTSRNAAPLLLKAAKLVTYDTQQQTWEANFNSDYLLTPYDIKILASLHQANQTSLQLARQAQSLPDFDWGIQVRHPALFTLAAMPGLNSFRTLASFLSYNVLYEHSLGNDAEALQLTRDIFHLSVGLEFNTPFIVTHLTSLGINALACERVQQISLTLRVTPDLRPQILRLIAELLDDRPLNAGFVRSLQGERMMMLDGYPGPALQAFGNSPVYIAFKPAFILDERNLLQRQSADIAACASPDYPSAMRLLHSPNNPPSFRGLLAITRFISTYGLYSDRFFQTQFNILIERRFAAIALATRLYRIDHDNQWPPSLNALVPTYLPSVPNDPFAANNTPLHYLPDPIHPSVYSIGVNGIDDGGSTKPLNANYATYSRLNCYDIVFPLNPPPPTTAPTAIPSPDPPPPTTAPTTENSIY